MHYRDSQKPHTWHPYLLLFPGQHQEYQPWVNGAHKSFLSLEHFYMKYSRYTQSLFTVDTFTNGNFSITARIFCPDCAPIHTLYYILTSLQQPPLYNGQVFSSRLCTIPYILLYWNLPTTATSVQRPIFFILTLRRSIHFILIETSLQQPPLYNSQDLFVPTMHQSIHFTVIESLCNGQLIPPQFGRCREIQLRY